MIRNRILERLNEAAAPKPEWKAMDDVVKLYYKHLDPKTGDIGYHIDTVYKFIRDHIDLGEHKGYAGYGVMMKNVARSVMDRKIAIQSEMDYKNFDPVEYDSVTRTYKLPKDRKEVVKMLRDYIKEQNKAYIKKTGKKPAPKAKVAPVSAPITQQVATAAAKPTAASSSVVTDADLLKVVGSLLSAFQASGRASKVDRPEMQGKDAYAGIRDWGNWQVPPGEEDDGDYDWEELTSASRKKADDICRHIEVLHKAKERGIKVSYREEEKNWLSLYARRA